MNELHGRTILITGASRGIGRATAVALAGAGARIWCLARPGKRLDDVMASLGGSGVPLPCDLTRPDSIDAAVNDALEGTGGAPYALVQAAGVFPLAPFDETLPDTFADALQINLVGPWRLAQPIATAMKRRGNGHLITIGSIADRVALPENAAYAASKFGARAVHEVLRTELRGTGVRVSLVSPGPVDTPIWDPIDPDHREGFPARTHMIRAEDVAQSVLFVLTRPPHLNIDELRLSHA